MLLAMILASAVTADELSTSLNAIRADIQLMGCTSDVACWKRTTLRLDDALTTAVNGLDSYNIKVAQMQSALQDSKPLLINEKQETPFFKEPIVWFAIGFVIGGAALIGGAAAFHSIAH